VQGKWHSSEPLIHEWSIDLHHACVYGVYMTKQISTHTALQLAAIMAQRGMSKRIGALQLSARLVRNGINVNVKIK
jgi:hypothetical protein